MTLNQQRQMCSRRHLMAPDQTNHNLALSWTSWYLQQSPGRPQHLLSTFDVMLHARAGGLGEMRTSPVWRTVQGPSTTRIKRHRRRRESSCMLTTFPIHKAIRWSCDGITHLNLSCTEWWYQVKSSSMLSNPNSQVPTRT
jgi:predicted NAD/FAD-binding protein